MLRECDACLRHVRVSETRCPFCDAALAAAPRLPSVPSGVRSRAAQIAIAATLIGCEEPKPPVAPHESTEVADASPPPPAMTTTTPPAETATAPATTAPPPPPPPPPNLKKPYGAPPADGLLV